MSEYPERIQQKNNHVIELVRSLKYARHLYITETSDEHFRALCQATLNYYGFFDNVAGIRNVQAALNGSTLLLDPLV